MRSHEVCLYIYMCVCEYIYRYTHTYMYIGGGVNYLTICCFLASKGTQYHRVSDAFTRSISPAKLDSRWNPLSCCGCASKIKQCDSPWLVHLWCCHTHNCWLLSAEDLLSMPEDTVAETQSSPPPHQMCLPGLKPDKQLELSQEHIPTHEKKYTGLKARTSNNNLILIITCCQLQFFQKKKWVVCSSCMLHCPARGCRSNAPGLMGKVLALHPKPFPHPRTSRLKNNMK